MFNKIFSKINLDDDVFYHAFLSDRVVTAISIASNRSDDIATHHAYRLYLDDDHPYYGTRLFSDILHPYYDIRHCSDTRPCSDIHSYKYAIKYY